MRLNRLVNLMIVSIILFSFFIVQPVKAEDDIENLVEVDFNIELKSATDFKISVTADVSKIYLGALEVSYTGSEIASIAITDPNRMSIIQYALKGMLKSQIEQTFGTVVVTDELPSYDSGVFSDVFDVNLTSSFFGMNETVNAYSFINGVLDMGATANYTFNLRADPGWNNTFTFNFGDSFSYYYVNTDLIDGNEKAIWKRISPNREFPESRTRILRNPNPTLIMLMRSAILISLIIDFCKTINPCFHNGSFLHKACRDLI